MEYRLMSGERVSLLGFGAMRLPTDSQGKIDSQTLDRMVDLAIEGGVNYFDTAYPYHGGMSEIEIGRSLSRYRRDQYYLATKYPGHQLMSVHRPAEIFEEQLKKCGVDYFDFYLLHNVCESSIDTYLNEDFGIINYFLEQKAQGRIKHLGFSTHARMDFLKDFFKRYAEQMEFCQIQLNYLDSSLQRADEKYELLKAYNIPVIVMEPVRGGKLAKLDPETEQQLKTIRPDSSIASFAFRYLMDYEDVSVILSGMSNVEQVVDNISTFTDNTHLTKEERSILLACAEGMKSSVPCTACGYCKDVCPMGLDIPTFMATYNELKCQGGVNSAMTVQFMPEEKQPHACIGCGACSRICPQNIAIPGTVSELCEMLKKVPSWAQICREREEIANRMKPEKT